MEKGKQINVINISGSLLLGVAIGCLIMYLTHKDIYHHYNSCQEQELLRRFAEENTQKDWYVKEDKNGKIKLIQLSNREIDSLNKIK